MRKRHLQPRLVDALSDTPVVFIQGPRQCGKTTLARSVSGRGRDFAFLTFDRAADKTAAETDPDGFVEALPPRVILDEVQRVPAIFPAIKRSVDEDRRPGRFLLTGSANPLVLPTVSESLTGRMEILTLRPFSQGELLGRREGFVDALVRPGPLRARTAAMSWRELVPKIVRGGFPEAVSRRDADRRRQWFESYITSTIERDVRDLANIQRLREMPRILALAAARSTATLNLSDLARDAQLPLTTLQRLWALLEATFVVATIPAWSANLTSRIVKSPKLTMLDTGFLCHLLGIDAARLIEDGAMAGPVLETFVVNELAKQIEWSAERPSLFHFRTHKQQEVDVVLETRAGAVVGIEVKKTASPSASDFAGLRVLKESTGSRFVRGVLLCMVSEPVAFGPDLLACPVSALWAPVARRAATSGSSHA
jgi:predicted AAA+ superfamily ATPase